MIDGLFTWIDNRLALSRSGRHLLNKIFPDHWSFMIGEIALYSFIVLLATGVFLTLYFVPSGQDVVYHGIYKPLDGQTVSAAFNSTVNLSFAVRGGLLMRQMHHWAANIFVGSIVVHMLRVFFTGGFRRPRELNWLVGTTLMILAIVNGFLGYSIPDDLVSGTGIRIAYSILESIPFVGSYLATLLFGGVFPGNGSIIPRFYVLHVLIVPLIILALLGAHLGMLMKHKHAQFAGNGAREDNVVGAPLWPNFMMKTQGFLFLTVAVTTLLGAFVQINPIWLYGPYVPFHVSYAVQPDWYMGWLDGALRVMPSWELHLPGHMIPNVFFPAVLMPGITFNVMMAWPWIEAKFSGDTAEHHLLDRPSQRPVRTAIGASVLSFYFVLFGASATDVLANYLEVSLNTVLLAFRVLCFVVPLIVYPLTYKICKEMAHSKGAGRRKTHNIVIRSAEGGYSTVPAETYVGYRNETLAPVGVDDVDLTSVMADNSIPNEEGVYQIPRDYR
jgi:ubiquinol-cytochrome c reductase cytochrome b subunit